MSISHLDRESDDITIAPTIHHGIPITHHSVNDNLMIIMAVNRKKFRV